MYSQFCSRSFEVDQRYKLLAALITNTPPYPFAIADISWVLSTLAQVWSSFRKAESLRPVETFVAQNKKIGRSHFSLTR